MTRRPNHLPLPLPAQPYGPNERRALFGERPPRKGSGVEISGPKALLDAICAWEHRHRCCVCGAVDAPWWCGEGTPDRPHQRLCTADATRVAQPSSLVIRGADADTEDLVLPGLSGVRVWHESEHPQPEGGSFPRLGNLPDWASELLTGDWVTPAAHPLLPVAGRKWLPVAVERGWAESRTETPEERQSRGAHTLGQPARAYRLTVAGVAPFRAALPRWSVGRG